MEPKDRVDQAIKTKIGAHKEKAGGDSGSLAERLVPWTEVEGILEEWPPAPQKVAGETIRTYGLPHEATPTMLVWHHNEPWKRTVITSDETAHDWPTPHTDYISQTINYDVPIEKVGELARYDGSLIIYRTAGQVTASCDNEASNFLALNLMHEIVTGVKTADEAREELAQQKAAWLLNRDAPYTERFMFAVPEEPDTGYVDEPMMKRAALHQGAEKVKDLLGRGDSGP